MENTQLLAYGFADIIVGLGGNVIWISGHGVALFVLRCGAHNR
jgi:hypothetical protein